MSQVFISYRHSDTHSPRVADLVKALRAAGVNVVIDSDQLPAGPNEGWPKWSQQQVHLADKVLIACTTGWRECYETTKTLPAGLGSAAEAHMIHQELYDKAFINEKFRVVLLDAEDEESIPKSLKAYQAYRYYLPEGEDLLLAWLGATRNKNPVVNWPVLSAHFERQLANRDAEFETLKTMLKGKHTQQALLIHGASGLGKTTLINEFRVLASHLGIDDTFVDCKITADLASALQLMQIMGFNPNSNKLIGVQRQGLRTRTSYGFEPKYPDAFFVRPCGGLALHAQAHLAVFSHRDWPHQIQHHLFQ